jgi:spore coat protein CotH
MKLLVHTRLAAALILAIGCCGSLSAQTNIGLTDPAAAFFDDREVREIRIYFEDANWYNTLLRAHQTTEDPYFPCRFKSGDIEIPKIGCRFKGNSSAQRNGIKKPFKLDFNEYDDNATFLGLKKLNVNNFDLQPDFMREKLLHDLAGKYVAALRSIYTRLYVNDAFYGLYLAVEQPDKVMMQSRYGKNEDGNLYEAEEQMGGVGRPVLSWLGSDPALYQSIYLLKTNEEANDFSRLVNFLDILNNTPKADLPAHIETIVDVENWMYGMAVNNLVVNLDSYVGAGAEYYLYDRTSDGKFVHIQWDNNETFGITGDGTPRLANPFITDPFWLPTTTTGPGGGGGGGNAAANARPFVTNLWAIDEYKRLYLRAMSKMLRENFVPESMSARVTQLATLIRPHVQEDPNKAYTSSQFETALNATVANIPGINQFVRERNAFLRPYLNGQASAVDIRINELAVVNDGSVVDDAGDADAWLEIHNPGPGPMALNGIYLTDNPENPTKWALPSRTLADGEFLTVWLDGETGEGETHANFTLPAEGGKIYLFASAISSTTPTDTLIVGTPSAGQSQIRLGLHGSQWEVTAKPTPGAENIRAEVSTGTPVSSGTGQLLINEFMADNKTAYEDPDESGAFEDWFEVYNPGSGAVDMSGMYITDNPDNPTKWKVGDGVVIPAGGYLIFMADNDTTEGPRHAAFALSTGGESLSIFAADGKTLIDTITFDAQKTDITFGRSPNGSSIWKFLAKPTPGGPNSGPLE